MRKRKSAASYKKYKGTKVSIDGVEFDSKGEAARYRTLKILEKAGKITNLSCHPEFEILPRLKLKTRVMRAMKYTADFQYEEDGVIVVEDFKGHATEPYRMRKKLFIHKYSDSYVFREVKMRGKALEIKDWRAF